MIKWVVFCLPTIVFSFGKLPEIVLFQAQKCATELAINGITPESPGEMS